MGKKIFFHSRSGSEPYYMIKVTVYDNSHIFVRDKGKIDYWEEEGKHGGLLLRFGFDNKNSLEVDLGDSGISSDYRQAVLDMYNLKRKLSNKYRFTLDNAHCINFPPFNKFGFSYKKSFKQIWSHSDVSIKAKILADSGFFNNCEDNCPPIMRSNNESLDFEGIHNFIYLDYHGRKGTINNPLYSKDIPEKIVEIHKELSDMQKLNPDNQVMTISTMELGHIYNIRVKGDDKSLSRKYRDAFFDVFKTTGR